ncbi:hypothetical protein VC83_02102 [Pseudogymnoascus destructans]|uniref:Vacuolar calcium ion transporter n=2 Tax=Pseudogymnoascus destructans TaxID=655981 RepID=L8G2N9_PSED2|nr:uncharacterized protein VC83_02102 [Pseudogymnoascus destructans]ELR07515.1 hypothetical protein GMDG_02606 [Pseudogymnoascus destructans 20631-21]OAF61704.1 hypothetical protein VC83_02102 [Pseudogymnoascus destructans]
MGIFHRGGKAPDGEEKGTAPADADVEMNSPSSAPTAVAEKRRLAGQHVVNEAGLRVTKGIAPDGESGRSWIHPWHFLRICFISSCHASMCVNILWPFVPAALAVRYARPDLNLIIFILSYIAMVPSANLVGFVGQEFSRKLPRVLGVLMETTFGSIIEIVLFMVLLTQGEYLVIQAAILGSVLATMLLCLGLCFFVGGLRRNEQTFDEAISEVGNGLLLIAGLGLVVPTAFYNALQTSSDITPENLKTAVLQISRITAILLIISYGFYIFFNMRSHHSIYDAIFLKDEHGDADREQDIIKPRLTLTESVLALAIAVALVTLMAISLVMEIPHIVENKGVSDLFMGLILVPLVEKAAEHITAIDEAWDNSMNFALAHILGATIQTALFNAPLAVIVSWGLHRDLDLNFDLFTIVVVILSIIVVGNFLKDLKSNYLEGALLVIVYIIIAVAAFYYPNPAHHGGAAEGGAAAPAEGH